MTAAMPHAVFTTVGPDLRQELASQYDLVWRERLFRMALTVAAYGLTTIYLPFWVAALAATINALIDIAGMRLMRGLDAATQPLRYRLTGLCNFAMEVCFAAVAALIWLSDAPFSGAFAMGMVMTALLHVSSVRAIHLPFGLAALAGIAVPVLAGNALRWVSQGDWVGLLLSTLAALAGLSYTLSAMTMTNRLHREAALGRAAAQAGFEAKNRFLAQMSHELRTPLNAILGMGHAELRRSRDELSRERLSVLISSAEGLGTILDDVLDMAAVQEGRIPIRPRVAIPTDEIRTAVALFRPGIEAAGLTLTTAFAAGLEQPAEFDTQRLRQCLSNLMSNALKNTIAGSIDIAARIDHTTRDTAFLHVTITDTGPGIPNHFRDGIFDPFRHRRHAPQHRVAMLPGSNGLGLSICQALARQMGGDLVLGDAQPGAQVSAPGAQFVLTLVLGDATRVAALPPPQRRASRPRATASVTGRTVTVAERAIAGLRVLVVDDIATNRMVAVTYLRMLGAQPVVAPGGDAALTRLRTEQIDLVLLDMNMPGMDGIETLRLIRALPDAAGKCPVIAMTADGGEEHRERYRREGLDGYLSKPISPDRIEAEISLVLRQRPATSDTGNVPNWPKADKDGERADHVE